MTCGLSDAEGYFQFADIAFGTYQLYPDVAGIPTQAMMVTITEERPTVNDISLVVSPEQVVFSVTEIVSSFIENALLIYPNPVRSQAGISVEMKQSSGIEIMITDLQGRTVYFEKRMLEKGQNLLPLNAGEFAAGFYQVTIIPEDNISLTGKFLKFN